MKIETSTASHPKTLDPKRILLVGPPGGGKTTLAMQFPGVCFVVVDVGLDGPEKYLRSIKPDLEFGFIRATTDDAGNPLPSDMIFDRVIQIIKFLGSQPEVKTIAVDNLLSVHDALVAAICKKQGRDTMEGRDWGPYQTAILNLAVHAFGGTGKTCILISHEFVKETARMGKDGKPVFGEQDITERRPAIKGKLDDVFAGYFTDAWRCYSEVAPGDSLEFHVSTLRTKLDNLKNSMGMPPRLTVRKGELWWPKLQPFFKDYYK